MKHTIAICMGSSCFARGNQDNLRVIEDFLDNNDVDCTLKGRGCIGNCAKGPNVAIDGVNFERVTPKIILELLNEKLKD